VTITETKGYIKNSSDGRWKLNMKRFLRYKSVYVNVGKNGDFVVAYVRIQRNGDFVVAYMKIQSNGDFVITYVRIQRNGDFVVAYVKIQRWRFCGSLHEDTE